MLRNIDKHIKNQSVRSKPAPPKSSEPSRRKLNELRLLEAAAGGTANGAVGEYDDPIEDETTDSNEFNSVGYYDEDTGAYDDAGMQEGFKMHVIAGIGVTPENYGSAEGLVDVLKGDT